MTEEKSDQWLSGGGNEWMKRRQRLHIYMQMFMGTEEACDIHRGIHVLKCITLHILRYLLHVNAPAVKLLRSSLKKSFSSTVSLSKLTLESIYCFSTYLSH